MKKKWEFYEADEARIYEVTNKFKISKLLAKILIGLLIAKIAQINAKQNIMN